MKTRLAAALIGVAGVAGGALADPANRGKVIITEIFANPNDGGPGFDHPEFIEIFNTTDEPIDIGGWRLQDEDGSSEPFPPGTILGARQAAAVVGANFALRPDDAENPGEYLPRTARWTVESWRRAWDPDPSDGVTPEINVLVVPGNITIANTPTIANEVPFIVDADGDIVDVANYQNGVNGWPRVTAGVSITLRAGLLDADSNDRGCAWQLASIDPTRLSSQEEVFVYDPDGEGGEPPITTEGMSAAGNIASPGLVDLSSPVPADCNNNGVADLLDICGGAAPTSQDCNGNGVPDECEPDCNGNGVPDSCEVVLNDEGVDCNLNDVPDACEIASNPSLDANGNGLIDACEPGRDQVIITEIMVDAFTSPDLAYVEIYNRSGTAVDISGYRLVDLEQGGNSYTYPVPQGTVLQPGGVAVLTNTPGGRSEADTVALFQSLWGAETPQGQPIAYIPLRRWGARANNGTPTAEVLALVRGAEIDDAVSENELTGPHPTRLVGTGVTNPGYVIDVANYSNATSNSEPQDGWPGTDAHGSFYVLPTELDFTANNAGPSWRLSIEGLDGAWRSTDLTGTPGAPEGIGNMGEDYGSPGYVPTGQPQQPTHDVIITEIAATTNSVRPGTPFEPAPPATVQGGFDEWVEIFNTTAGPVDVSGWYLQDEEGRTAAIPAGTTLAPGEAAVIVGLEPSFSASDVAAQFGLAWGCGYKVIPVGFWYNENRSFGIGRLNDQPNFRDDILRLVKADGTVADIANYDDDGVPTGIAQPPFGWPVDAAGAADVFWSIYLLPGSYTGVANDNGVNWASAFPGLNGGRQSVADARMDGSGNPAGIFNASMYGSPGFVEGRSSAVTPPESCPGLCRADFDGANGVQVADIFAFLRAWFANAPSADFDGTNGIQVADIFAFLRNWFAGC